MSGRVFPGPDGMQSRVSSPGSLLPLHLCWNYGNSQDVPLKRPISMMEQKGITMNISVATGKTSYEKRFRAPIGRYAGEDRLQ